MESKKPIAGCERANTPSRDCRWHGGTGRGLFSLSHPRAGLLRSSLFLRYPGFGADTLDAHPDPHPEASAQAQSLPPDSFSSLPKVVSSLQLGPCLGQAGNVQELERPGAPVNR